MLKEKLLIELKKLNKQQLEACETIYGPVMVLAGPGTGKTQVLALRIANILYKTDVLASNILCLTFTESGVQAMRERLKLFLGIDAYKVGIFTFHSFANSVIQEFPDYFSFSKDLIQLDDITRLKIIRESIEEAQNLEYLKPFYNKFAKEKSIISSIQTLKKEGITPETLKTKTENLIKIHEENKSLNKKGFPTIKWKNKLEKLNHLFELVEVYKLYQEKLLKQGFYDFEDMILFVCNVLEKNEKIKQFYQEKYQFIHVDEYQDTNGGQEEILNQLTSFDRSPNIFVVGDDDQAIYRFQGANLENILSFNHKFKNVKTIPITINYRSTQKILDLAESIISNNNQRLSNRIKNFNKKLTANFKHADYNAELYEFKTIEDEYIYIAKKIEKLMNNGNSYNDIAILYRKNTHGLGISEVLRKYSIPIDHKSDNNALKNETVKNIIKILAVVDFYNKNSDLDLYRVMLLPYFNIPIVEVYELVNSLRGKRLVEAILNLNKGSNELKKFRNFYKSGMLFLKIKSFQNLF